MRLANAEVVPLHSLEMEMSTLGSMMLSEQAAEEVLGILDADDFYRPAHREIFRAIRFCVNRAVPPSLEFVIQQLRDTEILDNIGGEDYVLQVAEYVPSPSNAAFYARDVAEKSMLRQLEQAGQNIVGVVHDGDSGDASEKLDKAEQLVFEVGRKRTGTYFKHASTLAKNFFIDVDNLIETGEPMVGLSSGFSDLDKMTTGFYPGNLVIVGARPSMGKTALVLDFALAAAKSGKGSVAIFSLEMSGEQLIRRMVSMVSGVNSHVLKNPSLSMDTYKKLADACDSIYTLPIYIDDASDLTPLDMRGKCRRLQAETGLSLVVIDYLQLMRGAKKTENRTQEISDIARSIKSMAKELGVPVVALSQLNRGVESSGVERG